MPNQPIVAITLGDTCGIGPEVLAKALAKREIRETCRLLIIGSTSILQRELNKIGAKVDLELVTSPDVQVASGKIPVLEPIPTDDLLSLPTGTSMSQAGKASVEWVLAAGKLAMDGRIQAMVTAPINKASASLAGYQEIGHMELLQTLARAQEVATMLITKGLRVVHLTTHRSLRDACAAVTKDNVLSKLVLTHAFFNQYGYPTPRIGVAALNPHGGESGLLGFEEENEIGPAIDSARDQGINVIGPVPADSIFNQAIDGTYDVVLAMYHDQGHIAVKVHSWADSVTINLGLPFLRVSVDHGTAFDIAGKNLADPTGMITAIQTAATLVRDNNLAAI